MNKHSRGAPLWAFDEGQLAAARHGEDWDVPGVGGVCSFVNGTIDPAGYSDEAGCVGVVDGQGGRTWVANGVRVAVTDSGCTCKGVWQTNGGAVIHGCHADGVVGTGQGYCEVDLPCAESSGCSDATWNGEAPAPGPDIPVTCANYSSIDPGTNNPFAESICLLAGAEEACCACGGGAHNMTNRTGARLTKNPWGRLDTCTVHTIVKDGCRCNVSSGYGWGDPVIQQHLSVVENMYGAGAAHLSTRSMCQANQAFDNSKNDLEWATTRPPTRDCELPFSSYGNAFMQCNNAGQLSDVSRHKTARTIISESVVPEVSTTWAALRYDGPNHLGLWCSALPEHQNGANHLGLLRVPSTR